MTSAYFSNLPNETKNELFLAYIKEQQVQMQTNIHYQSQVINHFGGDLSEIGDKKELSLIDFPVANYDTIQSDRLSPGTIIEIVGFEQIQVKATEKGIYCYAKILAQPQVKIRNVDPKKIELKENQFIRHRGIRQSTDSTEILMGMEFDLYEWVNVSDPNVNFLIEEKQDQRIRHMPLHSTRPEILMSAPRAAKAHLKKLDPNKKFSALFFVTDHAGKEWLKLQTTVKDTKTNLWITKINEIDPRLLQTVTVNATPDPKNISLDKMEIYHFQNNQEAVKTIGDTLIKLQKFITMKNMQILQQSFSILPKTTKMKKLFESYDFHDLPMVVHHRQQPQQPAKVQEASAESTYQMQVEEEE